jgi:(DL)-glycerol-3-phosphatase
MQDTERFYTIVQQDILKDYGKEFTWELKAKMMGKKALQAAQTLVQELDLEGRLSPEEFIKKREEMLHVLFPQSQLLPGVERLVRHLKASQVPICVATSSHQRHFELKTSRHTEFFSLFDHIITGDDVPRGKPAPDIFNKAASVWSEIPRPEACLVFEDAPSGVAAAKAANMRCIMIPDANMDVTLTAEADEVLRSMLDFRPEKYGLPAILM